MREEVVRFALAFEENARAAAVRIAEWERWLVHDPNDTEEARAAARDRELLEAV
jgi:hypothetical protein